MLHFPDNNEGTWMHRKNTFLDETLPRWFSGAGLSLLFLVIYLGLTRDFLPEQIFMLLQSASSQGAEQAGLPFGEMLMTAFLLYGLLTSGAALLTGFAINQVIRLAVNKTL